MQSEGTALVGGADDYKHEQRDEAGSLRQQVSEHSAYGQTAEVERYLPSTNPQQTYPASSTVAGGVAPTDTGTTREDGLADGWSGRAPDDLRRAILPLLRHTQKLPGLRDGVLALRSRTKAEWQVCMRNLDFVRESQSDFSQEAEALQARKPKDFSASRLHILHARVCEDHDRQNTKVQVLLDIDTQLRKTESKLQRLERKMEADVRTMGELLGQAGFGSESASVTANDSEEASSVASHNTRSQLPVIVEHYLEKVGDMKIEQERLYDLDQEYIEMKGQRQLLQDQGLILDSSDDQFENQWLYAFAEAEVALDHATNRVKLARKACDLENIDPEAHRKRLSKLPHHSPATPLHSQIPSEIMSPLQLAIRMADDAQTPLEQLFLEPIEKGNANEITANDPFLSPSQRPKQTELPHMERVSDWVDLITVEQLQSPGSLEDFPALQNEVSGHQIQVSESREQPEFNSKQQALEHFNLQSTDMLSVMERTGGRKRSISDTSPLQSISGEHSGQISELSALASPHQRSRSLTSQVQVD